MIRSVYPLIDPQTAFVLQTYKGQVVIVTGGSSGIGFATALMYARAGARVLINGRNGSKLQLKKSEIEEKVKGAEVLAVAGDVSEVEVGREIVKAAVEEWGRVDVVLANSAVVVGGARVFCSSGCMVCDWLRHRSQVFMSKTLPSGGTVKRSTFGAL